MAQYGTAHRAASLSSGCEEPSIKYTNTPTMSPDVSSSVPLVGAAAVNAFQEGCNTASGHLHAS